MKSSFRSIYRIGKQTLIMILVLFLSACSFIYKTKIIDGFEVNQTDLIAASRQFDRVVIQRLFASDQVYQVSSEEELALLIVKKLEVKENTITYISDQPLNLHHVYLYVESLFPESFSIQAGEITYKDEKGNDFIKTAFVEVIYDHVHLTSASLISQQILLDLDVSNLDDRSKIKAIHDYLVTTVSYDESVLSLDLSVYQQHPAFSSYGALFNQSAVCSGYARAFMLLAHQLNIPTMMISSQEILHAWNLVYVDGDWLYLDVTWNDLSDNNTIAYTYYLDDFDEFVRDGLHIFDQASESTLTQQQFEAFARLAFGR